MRSPKSATRSIASGPGRYARVPCMLLSHAIRKRAMKPMPRVSVPARSRKPRNASGWTINPNVSRTEYRAGLGRQHATTRPVGRQRMGESLRRRIRIAQPRDERWRRCFTHERLKFALLACRALRPTSFVLDRLENAGLLRFKYRSGRFELRDLGDIS